MEILDLILSRRTIHSYTPEKVPKGVIEKAILSAVHAPNHKCTWPWRFYIVGPKSREKLAQLNVELKEQKTKIIMTDVVRSAAIRSFLEPGVLIAACIIKSDDAQTAREDYASLACALQNMSLYLASEGFGSKWGTGDVMRDERAYEILDIPQNEQEICGLFWVGRARVVPDQPSRPPLGEFFFERD